MRKTVSCCLILILSAFAGSALAGQEGIYNTFYGYDAGNDSMTGHYNTIIGGGAGAANTTGYENIFIGRIAGYLNTTGYYNTFLGHAAGYSNSEGYENTFIGYYAGAANTTARRNTFLGSFAGRSNTEGRYNTFLGVDAGRSNTMGNYNTFIGRGAGYYNTIGNGNIFLGLAAGANETGNNKLYIANSDTATPLIYGEFENNIVTVNGNLGIGTKVPVRQLHVVGDQAVIRMDRPVNTAAFMLVRTDESGNPMKTFVVGTNASASDTGEFVINDLGTAVLGPGSRRMTIATDGSVNFPGAVTGASFTPTSSAAFKTNIRTYENALETVKKLRGVRFDWKDSGKASVGLIAEEVDKVIPEVVAHNNKNATGVNYDSLVGVLVEAVKEQEARHQAELKEQQKTISALSEKVTELERLLIMSNSVSKAD